MKQKYIPHTKHPTDESIGYSIHDKNRKVYDMDGYDEPQQLGYGFRLIKRGKGVCLQKQYTGPPRGESTQTIWADIPVYNEDGSFSGYEF